MQAINVDVEEYEAGYTKLLQLAALLACTSGPGFEPFMSLNPTYQDRLIMLAADLADEAIIGLAILN